MSARDNVLDAVARGVIAPANTDAALRCVDANTSREGWQRVVKIFLLVGGGLSIAIGIGFFIAFNWTELGRVGKFAVVIAALLAATTSYVISPKDSIVCHASEVVVVLLMGTLLALFGQIYQTGADRWQLFARWALLVLPFVFVTRSFWAWIVWLLVADIAVVLFAASMSFSLFWLWVDEVVVYWALGLFNALFALAMTVLPGLVSDRRWRAGLVQTAVITAGTCASLLAINTILVGASHALPGFVAWLVTMAIIYYAYRVRTLNLVLMSGFALSAIAVSVALFIRLVGEVLGNFDAGMLLMIALFILGLATYAGRWLYGLQRVSESGS